jgi:hypothetical protein
LNSEEFTKSIDVGLSHLECFVLGELVVGAEARDDLTEFVKGIVQTVHSTPLPAKIFKSTFKLTTIIAHFNQAVYQGCGNMRENGN